ncbi:MAG: MATE family efflux transporter [Hungatella hathewayi]|uniref:MATE family efflux transporter n=1 Tax=Hungatella TaxID=1649459 RepID=UPI001105808A|nr:MULTISPECIES: MATE family efflux transporter [Hungatella]MCI7380822.1 MATE family efflux transporter [Hungatella sp.]MDY6235817.1 MATE family efflux transporter [Hungatella hathewayi]
MTAEKRIGIDLTTGRILPVLLIFVLPIFLSNTIQQLYNAADLMIIGRFAGSEGTVGVSTGGEIVSLFTFVSNGFQNAVQVYVAQLAGKREEKKIRDTIGTALSFLTLVSLLLMLFTMIFCRVLLTLINTPPEAFEQAVDYMMITALGLPFIFGYNAVCGILCGMGESRRPLEFVTVAAVSNIFLDIFFVVFLKMGAAGTAWATVLAQFLAFGASLTFLYQKREQFGFEFKVSYFKIRKQHLVVLLKLGIPLAAQSAFIHLSQLYCAARVNQYGLVMSAVNSVGNKIVRLANIITTSLNAGTSALVGQNLGARKYIRVRHTVYTALVLGISLAAVNTLMAIFIPRQVFSVFSNDPEVIEYGVMYMHISIITFILSGLHGPFGGVVTGSGFSTLNFIMGMLDGVILRIGISLFLAEVVGVGVYGYFYGNALARLAPLFIASFYFFSGKWEKRKLLSER